MGNPNPSTLVIMTEKTKNDIESKSGIPEFLYSFFWEYDLRDIDIVRHADFIIGRIMERGSWESMVWLKKEFPRDVMRNFLEKRGKRILSPRELNYWAFVVGIPAEKRQEWLKKAKEEPHAWRTRHSH